MMQAAKVLLSLLSAALPLVEKYWMNVLPVSARIRDGVLPVTILASLAARGSGGRYG